MSKAKACKYVFPLFVTVNKFWNAALDITLRKHMALQLCRYADVSFRERYVGRRTKTAYTEMKVKVPKLSTRLREVSKRRY